MAKKTGNLASPSNGLGLFIEEAAFTIQFFSNPSSTNDGKKFIGQKSVTTDASGNATYTFSPVSKIPVGQTITATATNASTHDNSEFSAPRKVITS